MCRLGWRQSDYPAQQEQQHSATWWAALRLGSGSHSHLVRPIDINTQSVMYICLWLDLLQQLCIKSKPCEGVQYLLIVLKRCWFIIFFLARVVCGAAESCCTWSTHIGSQYNKGVDKIPEIPVGKHLLSDDERRTLSLHKGRNYYKYDCIF